MTTTVTEPGLDQTISDATLHTVDELDDGDVVVGGGDPMPYIIAGGERRPVESTAAFFSAGYEPSQVKVVLDPKLGQMPIGAPITATAAVKPFESGNVFLGAGHYMRTWGP